MAFDASSRYETQPLLADAEQCLLLADFNDTQRRFPIDVCVHRLFEEQAARTPEAVALRCGAHEVTYRELNARANQLAHYLREAGVRAEARVGICVERDIEMVVGLLGILKAGGAYVPLDPELPTERLAFMLADTGAQVVLCGRGGAARLPEVDGLRVVTLGEERVGFTSSRADNVCVDVSSDNLAYVMYTSGSTGQPKGVMISHRSIVNHILWMQDDFPLTPHDRVLQLTRFSFDVSVWEIFGTLAAGACLVIPQASVQQDGVAAIVKTIAERGVTVMQVVPAFLNVLLEETALSECTGLRRVHCGGEAMSGELLGRFLERSEAELYNMYGPTETCIDAAYLKCEQPDVASAVVAIGVPVANTRLYVLNKAGALCPVGTTGELYVGGAGLARGYLGRAQLTAEKFVPDPFSVTGGERLYRTGDLARRRGDGRVEYVGRIDHQVKVRGFRIELGEIEATLRGHAAVRDAVVVVQESATGEKYLVAYVVEAKGIGEIATDALRDYLSEHLPEYMVPSVFVALGSLPLMPNGKVDRLALPAHEGGREGAHVEYVAPRTPTEELLVGIWSKTLGVERIGIADNFFALGGHSLTAVLVVSRVNAACGVEIPLRVFIEQTPTVERLSALVEISQLEQANEQELSSMLNELNQLSEDEVKALLANEESAAGGA